MIILALGAYDFVPVEQGSFFGLWLPEFLEIRASETFTAFARTMKIDGYWRAHGFPP